MEGRMIMTIFYFILTLLLWIILIVLFRAIRFNPPNKEDVAITEVELDQERIITNFTKLLRCKTISYDNKELIDWDEFIKFKNLLAELYPNIHRICHLEEIGSTGLLYLWKGKSSEKVSVLMSHYDVVPVNEEQWTKPAFDGIVEDNVIWGRGTLDTKGTLCGILEAAEDLILSGFIPENDIYFSFTGEEEIGGPSTPLIVEFLKGKGIHPALVLDEGGAILENIFPGVKKTCAVISTSEKMYMDIELSTTGKGGHSSAPPSHTPIGILSKAVVDIENHPFQSHLTPPIKQMFDILGRHSSFVYKVLFANLWLFKPVLDKIVKKSGGQLNALLRTTCAVTKMEGSEAFNVIPPVAKAGMNLRLLKNDTAETAVQHIRKVIKNDSIKLSVVKSWNAVPFSNTSSEGWKKLEYVIHQTWGDVIVTPTTSNGGTDSRHYSSISENVFRFSPMRLSKEEIELMHGNDERILVSNFMEMVSFFKRLIHLC
jgi:carboxypeptidase PM20D1